MEGGEADYLHESARCLGLAIADEIREITETQTTYMNDKRLKVEPREDG